MPDGVGRNAARVGDWKLVDTRAGAPMLFNLQDDIGEQHDLTAAEPAIAQIAANLASQAMAQGFTELAWARFEVARHKAPAAGRRSVEREPLHHPPPIDRAARPG